LATSFCYLPDEEEEEEEDSLWKAMAKKIEKELQSR
jgi:hypothetical protein